jgi:hypothetical protein
MGTKMERLTLTSESYTLGLTSKDDIDLYNMNRLYNLGKDVLGVFPGGDVYEYQVQVQANPNAAEGGILTTSNRELVQYIKTDLPMYFVERSPNWFVGMLDGKLYIFGYARKRQNFTEYARVGSDEAEFKLFSSIIRKVFKRFEAEYISARIDVKFREFLEIRNSGTFHISKNIIIDSISSPNRDADCVRKYANDLFMQTNEMDRWFSYAHYGLILSHEFKNAGLNIKVGN